MLADDCGPDFGSNFYQQPVQPPPAQQQQSQQQIPQQIPQQQAQQQLQQQLQHHQQLLPPMGSSAQGALASAQQRKRPRAEDGDFLGRAPIYPVQKAVGGPIQDSGHLNISNKTLSSAPADPMQFKRQRIDNVVDNVLAGIQNSQRNSKNVLAGGDSSESPPIGAISSVGDFKKEPKVYSKSEKNSSR